MREVREEMGINTSSRSTLVPTHPELLEPDFIAVDFETANRKGGISACQIALVKVNNGTVIDRYATFIKPPDDYHYYEFTYLHGISTADTQDAPPWDAVASSIADFTQDLPTYAHNASFDRTVWNTLDEFYQLSTAPSRFFCSYLTARRVLPGLENYKLPTVTRRCAPNFHLNHHRADSDAEACGLIVAALQNMTGLESRL